MRLVREQQQAQAGMAAKKNKGQQQQGAGAVSSKGCNNGGGSKKKGSGGQHMKADDNIQVDPRAQNAKNIHHHNHPNANLVEMNNLMNLGGQQAPSASVLPTNPNISGLGPFQVHPNHNIHPPQHGQQQLQQQPPAPAAAAMLMNMNMNGYKISSHLVIQLSIFGFSYLCFASCS